MEVSRHQAVGVELDRTGPNRSNEQGKEHPHVALALEYRPAREASIHHVMPAIRHVAARSSGHMGSQGADSLWEREWRKKLELRPGGTRYERSVRCVPDSVRNARSRIVSGA